MPAATSPAPHTRDRQPDPVPAPGAPPRSARWRRSVAGALIAVAVVVIGPPIVRLAVPEVERDLVAVTPGTLDPIDVRFTNDQDQLELAGQLFLPDGPGPYPAAALINGSGDSVRDNGWYLTMSAHLVDRGYAVLWPDKRGSGASEGDWHTASFEALARDAMASVDHLVADPRIAPDRIGVVGMSQGGRIASLVAAQRDDLAYVVSFAGGVLPAHDSLRYEETHNLRQLGFLPGISDVLAGPSSWAIVTVAQAGFWDAVGNFDPLPHWADAPMPVLFQFGAEDTNVDTATSVARLEGLEHPDLRIEVYPGSGHALEQPPDQGDALIRPDALDDLTSFLARATGRD